jgi:PKD repeat protein
MDEDDDPVISHIYSHNSFTSPRNLNVRLLAKTPDGCETLSEPLPITINPRVQARIVADNTVGCAPLDVNFSNFSRGHNTSRWYKRRVGDANFVEFSTNNITTLHTFHNLSGVDEEYEVMYIAYSNTGCRDTATVNITVFADLEASFEADPAYQLLPDRTVTITRPSSNIPDTWDFYWEFGDGFTSTQPNPAPHTYANYGRYEIILTVSGGGCVARHSEIVEIIAIPPVVDFEYDPERGCSPLRVNFTPPLGRKGGKQASAFTASSSPL